MRIMAYRTRSLILIGLVLSLPASQLHAQQPVDASKLTDYRRLRELGDLRLKTYSIHGLAPLVVLLTAAPDTAALPLKSNRRSLTKSLMDGLGRLGVSLFSVRSDSDSVALDALRALPLAEQPHVIIAFGERSISAVRFLAADSFLTSFVALAPGSGAPSIDLASEWSRMLQSRKLPRAILVLESGCDSSAVWLAQIRHHYRQTVLVLPDHDAWLAPKTSAACPTAPTSGVGMEYELATLVLDWVRRNTGFPE
jgi:hypothetical protein